MTTLADIAEEAKGWQGTPFHWQAALRGVGCDCKGLVVGVARALELPEAQSIYAEMAAYPKRFDPRLLRRGLAATLRQVAEPQAGLVALVKFAGKPQHLAILTDADHMVHCYNRADNVVKLVRTAHWTFDSYWTWPSLHDD